MRRSGAIRRASSSATGASLEALLSGVRSAVPLPQAKGETVAQALSGAEAGFAAWNATPVAERAAALERTADLYERHRRCADRAAAIGRRQDARRCARRSARGGRLLPLLCGAGAQDARARTHAGTDGRNERAASSRARRVRLHQPVEFSARDLYRPDRRRARCRKRRHRQARRTDAADRVGGGAPDARCGHSARCAAFRAGRWQGRSRARRRCARRGRRVHRLDRGRVGDQPRARRQGRADRAADRRDRRHQCDDRGRDRTARTGDRRRHHLGLPLSRPALLGAAASLRAGGCRRPHPRDDRRRGARARRRRSARDRDPCRVR